MHLHLGIVNSALEENRARAVAEGIKNLSFVSYDGIDFPFDANTFDLVVTKTESYLTEQVNNILFEKNSIPV